MAVSDDPRNLKYVGHVDENLLCPICAVPFITPMQTSCRHVFCSFCISSWLENSGDCPSCRTRLATPEPGQDDSDFDEEDASHNEMNITPVPLRPAPMVLIGILDSIRYYCPNSEQGCQVQLSRDMMETHVLAECPYTMTACPDKHCDQLVAREKRDSKTCGHKLVSCNICGEDVKRMDVSSHLTTCPENVDICELCHETHNKLRKEEHEQKCPEVLTHCLGEKIGCAYYEKRTLVDEHAQACPFAKLYGIVGPMESQMKKMTLEHSKLKTDTERLKKEVVLAERFKDDFFGMGYRLNQAEHKSRIFEEAITRHDENLYSLLSHITPIANDEAMGHVQPWRYELAENARMNDERLDRLQQLLIKQEMTHHNEVYGLKEEVGKLRHVVLHQNLALDNVFRNGSRPFNTMRMHDDGNQGPSSSGANESTYGNDMSGLPQIRSMGELARSNVKL